MSVIVNGNEIVLTGTVGDDWWGDGFTPPDVILALAEVGRTTDIVVRLNSGGGIATDGSAIHAALEAHKGRVEIVVEGIAASAASVIAMAADRLVMSTGAVLMIHDPALVTWGNAAAHAKSIEQLDRLGDSFADIYAEKTGKPVEEMRAAMKAETWMTAQEAVDAGFADAVGGEVTPDEPTAFAYGAYAHAPKALASLAEARGWKPLRSPVSPTATAATPPPASTEESTMTDPAKTTPTAPQPDAGAAAKARIRAITTAEAAAGREALAEHLAFETDLAAEAALAVLAAAPKGAEARADAYAARRAAAADLARPGDEPVKEKKPGASLDPRAIYAARAAARAAAARR
jgi:ATP-dependent protease ClpP protease subunit